MMRERAFLQRGRDAIRLFDSGVSEFVILAMSDLCSTIVD
jgi:hypothetical protein